MRTTTSNRIAKLRFYEPCRNLPHHKNGKGEEWLLAYRFAQAYVTQFRSLHRGTRKNKLVVAREIPANGYGIADIIAVNWQSAGNPRPQSSEDFLLTKRPTIRAFEIKISDWRRALRQANRYRFFAHVPIVVLPVARLSAALDHIETFRILGVGLWTFDMTTNRIIQHHTPRPRKPLDKRQEKQAMRSVAKATRVLPVF